MKNIIGYVIIPYMSVEMSAEIEKIVRVREKRAARLFSREKDRKRVIRILERRCEQIPERADAALVLGTSPSMCPDKFGKRVGTGAKLVINDRVPFVIFSGKQDHETNDTDQAQEAKKLAISEFGLNEENIKIVGGNNTDENMKEARDLLARLGEEVRDIYLVSDGVHLIRALPQADDIFEKIGVHVYPFPILNEGEIDPNDPRAILETVKAGLYHRTMFGCVNDIGDEVRPYIDPVVSSYTRSIREMPEAPEITFDEWRSSLN